jgi:hypothetical protein
VAVAGFVAVLLVVSATVEAQGLRESALQLLADAEQSSAEPCVDLLPRAQALLTEVETAEASAFMPDETHRLRALLSTWLTECGTGEGVGGSDDAELRMLLWRCEDLGEARAFCELRAQCGPVSQMSQRMMDFWRAAAEFPCE